MRKLSTLYLGNHFSELKTDISLYFQHSRNESRRKIFTKYNRYGKKIEQPRIVLFEHVSLKVTFFSHKYSTILRLTLDWEGVNLTTEIHHISPNPYL